MDAAIGAARELIGSVVNLLRNELVEAYVASVELGLNSQKIKDDIVLTQALLHEAQRRDVTDSLGLQQLLLRLSAKADEAEDLLDELHYFIIQDQLDGTHYAVPDLGNGLRGHASHIHHAIHHIVGNYILPCFSCWLLQDDHGTTAINDPHMTSDLGSGNDDQVDKLRFDRVAMSKKIKPAIEEIHSLCDSVAVLLRHHTTNTSTVNLKRPLIGSTIAQDTLYGRRNLFEKTINDITTSGTNISETLSVLPIVGPGGIGKTTFAQHIYNDKRIQDHFDVRVWVCVSTEFDVLKLSQQILSCIDGSDPANQTTNLDHIQISIQQRLKSKRFLIVFDDIWECSNGDWENLIAPLKKRESKGSMFLVTTRFPYIVDIVQTTHSIALKGLEPDDFFKFFEEFIFGEQKNEGYHDDLTHIARDIAEKLKGSPLAAKTVGRMLKKDLSREHWMRVLENNEWQKGKSDDDIMPSLRISYNYLPFHLKRCFPYFSLFPEDYKFENSEMVCFWSAIGIIDSEVIHTEEKYMEELVNNGFLMKENNNFVVQYYVLHDLFHELSRNVSSRECLNISSSSMFRGPIPKSIRHLSITMKDPYDCNFRGEMVKLNSRVDLVNLRALMTFKEYGESIDKILEDTFKEIQGLRVLCIRVKSPGNFPCNLSKLIHLRYLKVRGYTNSSELILPRTLSRCYHLKVLDLNNWFGKVKLPEDISGLINLRHLFSHQYHQNELLSSISHIGKMKCLKELTKFNVKKESAGFEMSELGKLNELGGKLSIYNLEKVTTKEEATKAKLLSKSDLKELALHWGTEHSQGESGVLDDTTKPSDVIDGLEPHRNLQSLVIKNHGGSTGPSWLSCDISVLMLTSLHLEGVSWVSLPPIGQLFHLTSLTLKNISGLSKIGPGFCGATQLKVIVLFGLPEFTEWVGSGTHDARCFSRLENIMCIECPNLCVLPFLQEGSSGSYTKLSRLHINNCPKLFLPFVPQTSAITHIDVSAGPSRSMEHAEHDLPLTRHSGAFQAAPKLTWAQLLKLTSLGTLSIANESSFLSTAMLSNHTSLTILQLADCYNLTVDGFNPLITAVNLKVLRVYNTPYHPRSVAADLLSELKLIVASRTKLCLPVAGCFFRLETLEVDSISAVLAAPVCSLFATTLCQLHFKFDFRVESFTEEEENALQLLTSLEFLCFEYCLGLPSLPERLHSLSSLMVLQVVGCPKIRSLPKEGLPTYLQSLSVSYCTPELYEQAKELERTSPYLLFGGRQNTYLNQDLPASTATSKLAAHNL